MNTLYYGDNLPILREHIENESVDLIYLDPPFNSNRSYNILFKEATGRESDAQITAFNDTWEWGPTTAQTLHEIPEHASHQVVKMINALVDTLGHNAITAYLVMMTARLVELHRVLKPTGSLYLHCDPTASHYLKAMMDAIFGPTQFRNEIIWKRTSAHSDTRQGNVVHLGRIHDVILFYTKSDDATRNEVYQPYGHEYVDAFYRYQELDGRRYRLGDLTGPGGASKGNPRYEFLGVTRYWRYTKERMQELYAQGRIVQTKPGTVPAYKRYLDEMPGLQLQDVWNDIKPIGAQAAERLGYPTQKPLALLERIIQASSNPGDVVLDPFCGCGTAVHAAQKLGRQWIGIDITHLAIALIKYRLESAFPAIQYDPVIGEPYDLAAAHHLAHDDRYQFQYWALGLIKARPFQEKKKGADTGIDGLIYIDDDPKQPSTKTIIVQVKSGKVDVTTIRELAHIVDREKAIMGVLLTLNDPTGPMNAEAIGAGVYTSPIGQKYPKIQILTITNALAGERPKYPYGTEKTLKQAQVEQPGEKTLPLF